MYLFINKTILILSTYLRVIILSEARFTQNRI